MLKDEQLNKGQLSLLFDIRCGYRSRRAFASRMSSSLSFREGFLGKLSRIDKLLPDPPNSVVGTQDSEFAQSSSVHS